jgi:ABC-2 type transport system permease protein
MATSLTPDQLVGGKAVGLIAIALTQILFLAVVISVGLAIGARFLEPLRELRVPWSFLLATVMYFVPAYALIAGMMIAIGSAVTETRQGQQIAGALNLLFTLPYFFLVMFIGNPNSPLAVILTLFPTSSFITVTLRWGLTSIPLWQLIASWLLLVATAGFSVWAAARIFRAGMLRYGQRLDFKGMIAAMRAKA